MSEFRQALLSHIKKSQAVIDYDSIVVSIIRMFLVRQLIFVVGVGITATRKHKRMFG